MSTPVLPFGSIERAVMALLVRDYAPLTGLDTRIGGDMPGTVDGWYIRIDRVSGGRSNSFEGDFALDVEIFSQDYLDGERIAQDVEGILLAHGYHIVIADGKRWVIDDVFQNSGIADLPWAGDDDTFRLGATYALTVRRSAGTNVSAPTPGPVELEGTFSPAFEYHKTVAAEVWQFEHGLGYRPGGVRVVADDGDSYFPVVVDIDENTIRLTFATAITGWAYLS